MQKQAVERSPKLWEPRGRIGFLTTLLLVSAPDAGAPATLADVKSVLNEFFRAQDEARKEKRLEQMAALKKAAASASGDERQLLDRMTRVLERNDPLKKRVPELADIARDLAKLARGRFDDEQAIAKAFLMLPRLADSAGLNPDPFRLEAMAFIRDLVARYPNEGQAHGLLASAMARRVPVKKEDADGLEQQRCPNAGNPVFRFRSSGAGLSGRMMVSIGVSMPLVLWSRSIVPIVLSPILVILLEKYVFWPFCSGCEHRVSNEARE